MLAMVACSAMLAVSGPDAPPPEVSQAYQEARASAGKSSEEQVRLALWCEARGLTKERLNHLALAVLSDPARHVLGPDGLVRTPVLGPSVTGAGTSPRPSNDVYAMRPHTAAGRGRVG